MIQRIQSVYLFLAGLIPALTFFTPIAKLQVRGGWLNISSAYYEAVNFPIVAGMMPWGITIATLFLVVINIWNIFCYKNRKKQIKIANWSIALSLLFYLATILHIILMISETEASVKPTPVFFAPLLAMFFILLARQAIKKDEALVRAADRIR